MKLTKNILKLTNLNLIKTKFLNCNINTLNIGDYLKIFFFFQDTKKKGGLNVKFNKITAILLKKKITYNNITIIVSTIYKNEKVKFKFILTSPLVISVNFLKKSLH